MTALSVTLDSLAAYAFARLEFPGKEILFWVVLITLMVPIAVLIVPLFFEVYQFHWLTPTRASSSRWQPTATAFSC